MLAFPISCHILKYFTIIEEFWWAYIQIRMFPRPTLDLFIYNFYTTRMVSFCLNALGDFALSYDFRRTFSRLSSFNQLESLGSRLRNKTKCKKCLLGSNTY